MVDGVGPGGVFAWNDSFAASLNARVSRSLSKPANAGGNNEGQLGLETGESVFQPSAPLSRGAMGDFLPFVDLGTGVTTTAITIGGDGVYEYDFTCALLSNGQIKCWGGSRIIRSLPYPGCQGVSVACLN